MEEERSLVLDRSTDPSAERDRPDPATMSELRDETEALAQEVLELSY